MSPELCSPVTHFILVIHSTAALFTGGGQWYWCEEELYWALNISQMSVFPPISSLSLSAPAVQFYHHPSWLLFSSLWTQSIKTQSIPHSSGPGPAPNGGSQAPCAPQARVWGPEIRHTCPLDPGPRVWWPRAPLTRAQGPCWPPNHFMCPLRPPLLHTDAGGFGSSAHMVNTLNTNRLY